MTKDAADMADTSITQIDNSFCHIGEEDSKIEDVSNPKDFPKGLTKVPLPSTLESQPGHSTKIRLGVSDTENLDTCRKTVQT